MDGPLDKHLQNQYVFKNFWLSNFDLPLGRTWSTRAFAFVFSVRAYPPVPKQPPVKPQLGEIVFLPSFYLFNTFFKVYIYIDSKLLAYVVYFAEPD